MISNIICTLFDIVLIILLFWDGSKCSQIDDLNAKVLNQESKIKDLETKVKDLEIMTTLLKTTPVKSKFEEIIRTGVY